MTSELFFVSVVVLQLVLLVLLILCWILRHSRSRNLTELRVSAGRPTRVLTIRTEPDHARQLLDRLLDRVFLQVEPGPEAGEELRGELAAGTGEDIEAQLESDSGSDTEVSTSAPLSSRGKTLHDKLWKWVTVAIPSAAPPPPSPPTSPLPPPPPPPPPCSEDQTEDLDLQWLDASQGTS
ncbi:zinc finger translocation-associated protein-like [Eleginops maclovinus]|uniref:zinc finger translocation-associated protein-like n=1 Tax=Eleginops maclovinus TaxID=56733 RepID=UPI003080FD71